MDELQPKWQSAPAVDAAQMRAEADAFYGDEDRVGGDDPWPPSRSTVRPPGGSEHSSHSPFKPSATLDLDAWT
ncbi:MULTISPECIES: hypothetical protein [unclassified Streptomyces]|uniref:hypothetical protein n=1 Tax=unclassified Streptomyces TaxID=2593676 RepID=UPI00211C4D9D|nr:MULTISPECIES: hypothetical protein [unclassified Streptomyces]